jgi:hypothetical protein
MQTYRHSPVSEIYMDVPDVDRIHLCINMPYLGPIYLANAEKLSPLIIWKQNSHISILASFVNAVHPYATTMGSFSHCIDRLKR